MQPDWQTDAGRALSKLAEAIRDKGIHLSEPIIVFGSGPLQICIDPHFLSADVDIGLLDHLEELKALVDEIGLSKGKAEFYIEVVPSYVFRTSPNWGRRAQLFLLREVKFLFPAPIDLLLRKLHRLDEKDLLAFELVLKKTGHPTEEELLLELRHCYEKFQPQLDGSKSHFFANTERLWPTIFGHPIDVGAIILKPVLEEFSKAGYHPDYLKLLRSLNSLPR